LAPKCRWFDRSQLLAWHSSTNSCPRLVFEECWWCCSRGHGVSTSWDHSIIDWSLCWRMACASVYAAIWGVQYIVVINSWNPSSSTSKRRPWCYRSNQGSPWLCSTILLQTCLHPSPQVCMHSRKVTHTHTLSILYIPQNLAFFDTQQLLQFIKCRPCQHKLNLLYNQLFISFHTTKWRYIQGAPLFGNSNPNVEPTDTSQLLPEETAIIKAATTSSPNITLRARFVGQGYKQVNECRSLF